jgi:hypothetical protein
MRWAQGGGGCVRSGRSARHWRGDGTGNHSPAAAPSHVRRKWAAAHVDHPAAGDDAHDADNANDAQPSG